MDRKVQTISRKEKVVKNKKLVSDRKKNTVRRPPNTLRNSLSRLLNGEFTANVYGRISSLPEIRCESSVVDHKIILKFSFRELSEFGDGYIVKYKVLALQETDRPIMETRDIQPRVVAAHYGRPYHRMSE